MSADFSASLNKARGPRRECKVPGGSRFTILVFRLVTPAFVFFLDTFFFSAGSSGSFLSVSVFVTDWVHVWLNRWPILPKSWFLFMRYSLWRWTRVIELNVQSCNQSVAINNATCLLGFAFVYNTFVSLITGTMLFILNTPMWYRAHMIYKCSGY